MHAGADKYGGTVVGSAHGEHTRELWFVSEEDHFDRCGRGDRGDGHAVLVSGGRGHISTIHSESARSYVRPAG